MEFSELKEVFYPEIPEDLVERIEELEQQKKEREGRDKKFKREGIKNARKKGN